MKSARGAFIIGGIIALASLGIVAYLMIWGPDHIEISGRSLPDLIESGDLLPVIIIPVVLIICAVSIVPFLRIIFPGEIRNAVNAQAKVLKVWDTGVSINDNPQVGLLLEVSPPGLAPFQVEGKTVVSRLNAALVQPGISAEIRYDPQKPKRMRILTLHVQAISGTQTAARLEELNDLREKNLITTEEYQQKRDEILKKL
jgi:hypothetical protein